MSRTIDRFYLGVAVVTVALIFVAFAAGCSGATSTQEQKQRRFEYSDDACSAIVIVDTETGVQYLCVRVYGNGVSVTPLLDQWGFPLLAEGHQRGYRVEPSQDVDERGTDDE